MTKAQNRLGLVLAICGCLLVSRDPTFCQRVSTIVGTISDSLTRRPVADANIVVAGTTLGASADSNGRYIVRRVPPGPQTVIIMHLGYNREINELAISADADTVVLNVLLSPTVIPLPGVTVLSQMRLHELARDSLYRISARVALSAKQIEEECLLDFDQLLHRHVPLAEGEYDLFVDGARFPIDLRDIIGVRNIKEIFVWRRIDAPLEFQLGNRPRAQQEPQRPGYELPVKKSPFLHPFIITPYIILIQTK